MESRLMGGQRWESMRCICVMVKKKVSVVKTRLMAQELDK